MINAAVEPPLISPPESPTYAYTFPMDTPFMVGAYLEAVHTQVRNLLVDCREYVQLVVRTKKACETMLRAMEDLFTIYHLPFTPYSVTPSIQHLLPRQYRAYCEGVDGAPVDPSSFERFADVKVLQPMRVFLDQLRVLIEQVSDVDPSRNERRQEGARAAARRARRGLPPLPSAGVPAIATWVRRTITKIIHRFLKLHVVQCTHAVASWTRDGSGSPQTSVKRLSSSDTRESTNESQSGSLTSCSSSTGSVSSCISAVECAGESYTPDAGLCRLQMAMAASSSSFDRLLHVSCCVVRNMVQLTQDAVNSNLDDMRPVMMTIDKVHQSLSTFLYADYSWFFLDVEHRLVAPLQQLNKKRSLLDRVAERFASKKAASPSLSSAPRSPSSRRSNVSPLCATFRSSVDTSSPVNRVETLSRATRSPSVTGRETHLERQQRILREVDVALAEISIQYLSAFGSCFFLEDNADALRSG